MTRLGKLDQLAVDLLEAMAKIVETDEWSDRIDDLIVETEDIDPDEEAALAQYDESYDRVEKELVRLAARAMMDMVEGEPNRIVTAMMRRDAERAAQT